jgi:hypothetical protein
MYYNLRRGLYWLPVIAFMAMTWLAGSSCKKEKELTSGGELRFSTDTLTFDTVFTSLSSATLGIKIFNPQDQRVTLSSVRVEGGDNSFFQLNVDGRPGKSVSDVEIAANDSIYVFATVRVDPTAENSPFIIEDKLTATLNGNDFSIPLIAYGQNAHYITDSLLKGSQTWLTDKPYVIFGYAIVDSAETLTIPAGCRIYMHANARLFVDGTLKAIGTKQDSIVFQGDRLDRAYFGYEGYPGEWGGIYFTPISVANEMKYVVLKNGGNGAQGFAPALIQVSPDGVAGQDPQLTMDKVVLENSIGYGLLSFAGTVNATNCLIHSCGASALALVQGGTYNLDHCTIATYGNNKIAHSDNPAAIILNYYVDAAKNLNPNKLTATLRNCVVAGSLTNEFIADSTDQAPASLTLQNCVVKAESDKIRPWVNMVSPLYVSSGAVQDSLFRSVSKADYHPSSTSVLIDRGAVLFPVPVADDLDGNLRTTTPDVGCYEAR